MHSTEKLKTIIAKGELEELKIFYSSQEKNEIANRDLEDCLAGAVILNEFEITAYLLSNGVSPDSKNIVDEMPAIMFATENLNFEIVKLLLDNGADVNCQDKHGKIALSIAIKKRRKSRNIIDILIEHGADRNLKNNYGVSPQDLAEGFDYEL